MKRSFSKTVHTNYRNTENFSYSLVTKTPFKSTFPLKDFKKSNQVWIVNIELFVKSNVPLDHQEYKDHEDRKVIVASLVRIASQRILKECRFG